MPPDKSVLLKIIIFISQPYVVGTQKDGSFEHPKHMFKLMDKAIIAISRLKILLNWPYAVSDLSTINHWK